jgi:hypothetical protein
MKRRLAVALLAVLGAAAGLSGSGVADNSAGFDDDVGDAVSGPDISRVEVSNDDVGNVTFRILLAGGASLASNEGIWLSLDTDENFATGGRILGVGPGGFDYALTTGRAISPTLCTRWQWAGPTLGGFTALDPGSLACSSAPGAVVIRINKSDLGGSNGVNLVAVSIVFDTVQLRNQFGDQAPSCGLTWNYKINVDNPPPSPAPQPVCAPSPPPPSAPPPAEHETLALSPSRASAPVSVAVETPIVDVTATASKPLVGFDLVKFTNVSAERVSASSTSGLRPELKIKKHLSVTKVTVHATGVEAGKLTFRVKATHVVKRTQIKIVVKQRYD